MGTLRIDETMCRRDGICAAICPGRLIEQQEAQEIPRHIPGAMELCIDCFHCVAACPHGALAIGEVDVAACKMLNPQLSLSPAAAEQFLRSRRSIRTYKDTLLEKETITELIQLASHAPAGHNNRDLRWTVIYRPAEVQRLSGLVVDWAREMLTRQPEMAKTYRMDRLVKGWEAGLDPINRNAPHLVIVRASKDNMRAPTSAAIALAYLELAAHARGIGACWAGYFRIAAETWGPLQETLPIKENDAVYGAMMLGYPRYEYHRLPPRPKPEITYF